MGFDIFTVGASLAASFTPINNAFNHWSKSVLMNQQDRIVRGQMQKSTSLQLDYFTGKHDKMKSYYDQQGIPYLPTGGLNDASMMLEGNNYRRVNYATSGITYKNTQAQNHYGYGTRF